MSLILTYADYRTLVDLQQSLQLSGISTKFRFKMSLNQNQNDYNGKPESEMEQLQVKKGKLVRDADKT